MAAARPGAGGRFPQSSIQDADEDRQVVPPALQRSSNRPNAIAVPLLASLKPLGIEVGQFAGRRKARAACARAFGRLRCSPMRQMSGRFPRFLLAAEDVAIAWHVATCLRPPGPQALTAIGERVVQPKSLITEVPQMNAAPGRVVLPFFSEESAPWGLHAYAHQSSLGPGRSHDERQRGCRRALVYRSSPRLQRLPPERYRGSCPR